MVWCNHLRWVGPKKFINRTTQEELLDESTGKLAALNTGKLRGSTKKTADRPPAFFYIFPVTCK